MKNSCVLHHPTRGYEAVKMGICWPAFFFTIVWAFCKQLWGLTAVLAGVVVLSVVTEVAISVFSYNILAAWLGIYGNRWRRWRFGKKGYEAIAIIEAVSPDRAITAYKTQHAD